MGYVPNDYVRRIADALDPAAILQVEFFGPSFRDRGETASPTMTDPRRVEALVLALRGAEMDPAHPFNPDVMTPDSLLFHMRDGRQPPFVRFVVWDGFQVLGPKAWALIDPYVKEPF